MSDLRLEFPTSKTSKEDLRPHLDEVLEEQLPTAVPSKAAR